MDNVDRQGAPGDAPRPTEEQLAESRRRFPRIRQRQRDEEEERLAERIAHQWAMIRADRRPQEPPVIPTGPSNLARAQVPWGVDLAAAWAWRALIIGFTVYVIARILGRFSVITLPLAIALLVAALVSPLVHRLHRVGLPKAAASGLTVLVGLGLVGLLLTFVGQQVATGVTDLADQVVKGLDQIEDWLKDGPLNASDSQINSYIAKAQEAISEGSSEGGALSQVTEVGTAVGHVVAGFFIILFATYFFLADGDRIWAWLVRLAPRASREHIDSSGQVAWVSLKQFVKATVIVAAVDAIGIMIVAAVLGVPFVLAIGVLVFLTAFIPMVGATVAGSVAVLVALVDQGPITALLMLGGVVLVQQIEGHILQPFLMGRFVSLHPLGVIIAIAAGVIIAGIPGALVAVPFAAAANAVVQHLATYNDSSEVDPDEEPGEDIEDADAAAPPVPGEGARE